MKGKTQNNSTKPEFFLGHSAQSSSQKTPRKLSLLQTKKSLILPKGMVFLKLLEKQSGQT